MGEKPCATTMKANELLKVYVLMDRILKGECDSAEFMRWCVKYSIEEDLLARWWSRSAYWLTMCGILLKMDPGSPMGSARSIMQYVCDRCSASYRPSLRCRHCADLVRAYRPTLTLADLAAWYAESQR